MHKTAELLSHATRLSSLCALLVLWSGCEPSDRVGAPAASADPAVARPLRPTEGPPRRAAQLWLQPPDGATAVQGDALAVALEAAGGSVDDAAIEHVRAALRLTSEQGELVPFEARLERLEERRPEIVYLHVEPVRALAEGWYTLAVATLPDGFAAAQTRQAEASDAEAAVELRVGSEPSVLAVRWCRSDEREAVVLELSEPAATEAGVLVDGCEVYPAEGRSAEAPETQVMFDCESAEERRVVTLSSDFVAASDLPFVFRRHAGEAAIEVSWESMPLESPSCRVLHL